MDFGGHVLQSLGRIEGSLEHVVHTLDSHSSILRHHAHKITKIEVTNHSTKKDGSIWQDMAIQLWSKVIVAVLLLAAAAFTNLAPEKMAQVLQSVFGK